MSLTVASLWQQQQHCSRALVTYVNTALVNTVWDFPSTIAGLQFVHCDWSPSLLCKILYRESGKAVRTRTSVVCHVVCGLSSVCHVRAPYSGD